VTSPNSYLPGNAVTLQGVFTNALTGALADPTVVTCRTRDPARTAVVYAGVAVTRVSLGVYSVTINPVLPGIWYYRFEGTGAVIAATEYKFEVKPSVFTAA